jgi:hypothetical protein
MASISCGVTMQKEGVRQVVSVEFHKAQETVTDHRPAPLVPPPSDTKTVEEEEDQPLPTRETLEFSNQE